MPERHGGTSRIREFGDLLPRLTAWRRTRVAPTKQPRDKAGASVVGWLLLGLAVLFGGLYVAAHYVAGDKVPRNTTVSGVRIGGHPQAEAAQRLRAGLADKVNREIATTIDGTPVEVDPAARA